MKATTEGLTQPLFYLPAVLGAAFDYPTSVVRTLLVQGKVKINGNRYHDLEARGDLIGDAEVLVGNRSAELPSADTLEVDYPHTLIHKGVQR